VQPLAVDRTLVSAYSFRLVGAPEQMFRDTVAFANVVNGTGSPVLTDDLEVYERAQHGLTTARSDWVYLVAVMAVIFPTSTGPGAARPGRARSTFAISSRVVRYLTEEP